MRRKYYIFFVLAILFIACQQALIPEYRWTPVTKEAEFSIRDGAGLFSFNNKLFLAGGWVHDDIKKPYTTNEIWVSEDDGKHWKLIGNAPWPGRVGAGYVVFDNKMWVISGDGHEDVWSSEDGEHWRQVTAKAPWGKRYGAYVAVFKDRLWLMGGLKQWDDEGNFINQTYAKNDVWSSRDGEHWTRETEHANWNARGLIHGYAVLHDKLWIIGGGIKGRIGDASYNQTLAEFNDVWSSEDGVNWKRELEHAPWKPRTHFSVTTYDGKIFLTDGSTGQQRNYSRKVWYSENGIDWHTLGKAPWKKRHASALVVHNNGLYIAQGYGNHDVWVLTK